MSHIIKVILSDKDYARIQKAHPDIERDIREFLGCTDHVLTDREWVVAKIRSFEIGTEFSYRDVFDNEYDKLTVSNAKMVRNVCKQYKFAECLGYNDILKLRMYRRIEEGTK